MMKSDNWVWLPLNSGVFISRAFLFIVWVYRPLRPLLLSWNSNYCSCVCLSTVCVSVWRGVSKSKGMWPAVINCTFCFVTNSTNAPVSPWDTTRQKQSSTIIELTTNCHVVLQKQLSFVLWYTAVKTHIQAPSRSIKVTTAGFCSDNDCVSIGMTLRVRRAVLLMLMQTVKTGMGFRGSPWAITPCQNLDKTLRGMQGTFTGVSILEEYFWNVMG